MKRVVLYQILADLVLSLHIVVVVFIIGGWLLIVIGSLRSWPVARSMRFRMAHLAAIIIVAGQAWIGAICPLTDLEMQLRVKARQAFYSGSFIEHWLQRILYFDAPAWVFILIYTIFGFVVAATWWMFPPRKTVLKRRDRV